MEDRGEDSLLATKVKKKRNVGKSCVAYGCKQRSGERYKQQGVTFHAFPWSKPDLTRKWEHAMHRKEFKATIHSRVCSNHFTPDCFDRTGHRVKIKPGAVPTVFDLPGHLVNPVHHQNPVAEQNGCSMTVPPPPEPTTSSPVEQSYEPVLEPSRKRPRNGSSLEENSNMTILPNKLRVCDGHNYCLPSPKVLKHRLNIMASALAKYKHKVKILRQRNRRLQSRVESLQTLNIRKTVTERSIFV